MVVSQFSNTKTMVSRISVNYYCDDEKDFVMFSLHWSIIIASIFFLG
jgi:hypothetical protein